MQYQMFALLLLQENNTNNCNITTSSTTTKFINFPIYRNKTTKPVQYFEDLSNNNIGQMVTYFNLIQLDYSSISRSTDKIVIIQKSLNNNLEYDAFVINEHYNVGTLRITTIKIQKNNGLRPSHIINAVIFSVCFKQFTYINNVLALKQSFYQWNQ